MRGNLRDHVLLVLADFWESDPHPFIRSTNGGSPIDLPFGVEVSECIAPQLKKIASRFSVCACERLRLEERVKANITGGGPAWASQRERVNCNRYFGQIFIGLGDRLNSRGDDLNRVHFSIRSSNLPFFDRIPPFPLYGRDFVSRKVRSKPFGHALIQQRLHDGCMWLRCASW